MQLCRNKRVICTPVRYVLLGESYQAITIDKEDDSNNYNEALKNVDAKSTKKPWIVKWNLCILTQSGLL